MTPTWPSTTAGADLLASWLRRTARSSAADGWVLRGSVATAALCDGARTPVDVDLLLPGPATLDVALAAAAVRTIASVEDEGGPITVESATPTWVGTSSPGLRVILARGDLRAQVDLAAGDPMALPPRPLHIARVGPVLACRAETLFAWKLHGLVERGRGWWRAKDLFDLDLLWRAGLDLEAARAEVALAFAARGQDPSSLDDVRTRPGWGTSPGSRRKWAKLARRHPDVVDPDALLATRDRVRAAVAVVLDQERAT
jgi:hypothetical protein